MQSNFKLEPRLSSYSGIYCEVQGVYWEGLGKDWPTGINKLTHLKCFCSGPNHHDHERVNTNKKTKVQSLSFSCLLIWALPEH